MIWCVKRYDHVTKEILAYNFPRRPYLWLVNKSVQFTFHGIPVAHSRRLKGVQQRNKRNSERRKRCRHQKIHDGAPTTSCACG
jgi:hypothetical protein